MEKYIVFYVNKNGLRDFITIDAVDFKNKCVLIHCYQV